MMHKHTYTEYPLPDFYLQNTCGFAGKSALGVALPPVESEDEVGHLIQAFRKMQARLKDFIARLETETARRNRLQGELDAAHQIQMEMLPQQGNAFLSGSRYQLWARLVPAKAVGGDLYTWLDVGRGSLLVDVPVNFPRSSVMDTLPLVHVRVLTVPVAVKCAATDVKLAGLFPSATAMPVTISAAATVARTPSFRRRMFPPSVVGCRCGKHDAALIRTVVKIS